jgi:hypothetical protein
MLAAPNSRSIRPTHSRLLGMNLIHICEINGAMAIMELPFEILKVIAHPVLDSSEKHSGFSSESTPAIPYDQQRVIYGPSPPNQRPAVKITHGLRVTRIASSDDINGRHPEKSSQ